MKKQVKTQIGKDDNILWVSKAGNFDFFII